MDDGDALARQFEAQRERLGRVAYRVLGSHADADDAVQETWVRLSRTGLEEIDNTAAWLTTVVSRVCLTMLQSRARRSEESIDERPEPRISPAEGTDPAAEAEMADAVARALVVVLDTLAAAERVAFVLHDVFAVPFGDIAPVLNRSEAAVRQLASRARRRVRGGGRVSSHDLARQRVVVDAFFAAARLGDLDALVAVLDPDVVLRTDRASTLIRGAHDVAGRARQFAGPERVLTPVLVDGDVGVLVLVGGRLASIMRFTVRDDTIIAIHAFLEPGVLTAHEADMIC